MKGQELKILFEQDKAYLTKEKSITLYQAGLPEVAYKGFKCPAYWIIRVINYNEAEQKLFCEVLSYDIGNTEFEFYQKQLSDTLNTIETVSFRSIDTGGLFKTLSGGSTGSFYTPQRIPSQRATPYPNEAKIRPAYKQAFTETFSIPIKKLIFIDGGVSFERKIQRLNRTLKFTIANEDIKEEFDAVKNYFGNVLKTKNIQVTADIELSGNEVTMKDAKSPEIEKINKEMIQNVKFEFLRSTTRKINLSTDKNLLTVEEYVEEFSDDKIKSNPFHQNDQDFLEDLLSISKTKHYKQLRFLSSRHASKAMKLRFVHNPFSFIFLTEGKAHHYLIWETLNTAEATYIWQINKEPEALESALNKLEKTINLIKSSGRNAFLITADDSFTRIFHDYTGDVEGFVKWKNEFERLLR